MNEPGKTRFDHVVFTPAPRVPRRRVAAQTRCPSPPRAATEPDDAICEESAAFIEAVLAHAGLSADAYRSAPLHRRLPACLRTLRADSISDAAELLASDVTAPDRALNSLLIGYTSFYRDEAVFDVLREQVIPRCFADRHGLDVWSVGCADGAELYTIAALLAEAGMLQNSRLRGTDCRPHAIDSAREAAYRAEALKSVPADLRERYFRVTEQRIRPRDLSPRGGMEWQVQRALDCADQSAWDVILCRNLGIYLTEPAVVRLWNRLVAALRPGGILVVGKAERPVVDGFTRLSPCIYLKTSSEGSDESVRHRQSRESAGVAV